MVSKNLFGEELLFCKIREKKQIKFGHDQNVSTFTSLLIKLTIQSLSNEFCYFVVKTNAKNPVLGKKKKSNTILRRANQLYENS